MKAEVSAAMDNFVNRLKSITRYIGDDNGQMAELLANRYGSMEYLAKADVVSLTTYGGISRSSALYLRLIFAAAKRMKTEFFIPGKRYNMEETLNYVSALFLDTPIETAYAIIFDDSERYIATVNVGEGRLNESEILPGKIYDKMIEHGGTRVILAHNHPLGNQTASAEDLKATFALGATLKQLGKQLIAHYLVTDTGVIEIPAIPTESIGEK